MANTNVTVTHLYVSHCMKIVDTAQHPPGLTACLQPSLYIFSLHPQEWTSAVDYMFFRNNFPTAGGWAGNNFHRTPPPAGSFCECACVCQCFC
jgi:hypothetical protein